LGWYGKIETKKMLLTYFDQDEYNSSRDGYKGQPGALASSNFFILCE